MKKHIHILGASGSGTTTVAQIVCQRLNYTHFDTDSYYWLPTEQSFTQPRPVVERLLMLNNDLAKFDSWTLSGSVANWGNSLIPLFDLVVFLYVPQQLRIERIKKREFQRYGDRMLPGGDRYQSTKEFIEWAGQYDTGTCSGRTLQRHEAWLKTVNCPVLCIVNENLDESIDAVLNAMV